MPETSAPEAVPPVRAVDSDDPAILRHNLNASAGQSRARQDEQGAGSNLKTCSITFREKAKDLIEKEDYKGLHADLKANYDSVISERDALGNSLRNQD